LSAVLRVPVDAYAPTRIITCLAHHTDRVPVCLPIYSCAGTRDTLNAVISTGVPDNANAVCCYGSECVTAGRIHIDTIPVTVYYLH